MTDFFEYTEKTGSIWLFAVEGLGQAFSCSTRKAVVLPSTLPQVVLFAGAQLLQQQVVTVINAAGQEASGERLAFQLESVPSWFWVIPCFRNPGYPGKEHFRPLLMMLDIWILLSSFFTAVREIHRLEAGRIENRCFSAHFLLCEQHPPNVYRCL